MMWEKLPNESSQIKRFAYNEEAEVLVIEFKNGGVYQYADVDEETVCDFEDAESHGSFFNTEIKGKYTFKKLTVEEAALIS